jgi:sulfate adenylyltransferase subunit 1
MAVQTVLRPHTTEHHDFRGYAGRIASGSVSVGDPITAYPGGLTSRVSALWLGNQPLTSAQRGQSVSIELEDDLDVARGSLLAHTHAPQPVSEQNLEATLCWLDRSPQVPGTKYAVRCATAEVRGLIDSVDGILDLHTLAYAPSATPLRPTDLGRIKLRLAKPLAFDSYANNRVTGAFILVDEASGATVAAGMIASA